MNDTQIVNEVEEAAARKSLRQNAERDGDGTLDSYKAWYRSAEKDVANLISALRESVADAPDCGRGHKMSKNPHPDAGKPETLSEVGAEYVCIPCTKSALHRCTELRYDTEAALRESAAREERLRPYIQHKPSCNYSFAAVFDCNCGLAAALDHPPGTPSEEG